MKLHLLLTGLLIMLAQTSQAAGDVERGRELHNDNCITCHVNLVGGDGTGIYTRADRKIESYEALQNQIMRCKTALGVPWPEHDIDDVLAYLNHTFYKFDKQ